MGLDFSHGDAHWSYTGFNSFRNNLEVVAHDNDQLNDPIMLLLDHSDCDGSLTWEECHILYPRLQELLVNNEDKFNWYDYAQGILLVEGLKEAADKKEEFEFV